MNDENAFKTGYLIIKVVYNSKVASLDEISSYCDYEIEHEAIFETEIVDVDDEWLR